MQRCGTRNGNNRRDEEERGQDWSLVSTVAHPRGRGNRDIGLDEGPVAAPESDGD